MKRIQRVLWRHVDVSVVNVAQHGLEGLFARHHFSDGDVHLSVLGHERAEHRFKIASSKKGWSEMTDYKSNKSAACDLLRVQQGCGGKEHEDAQIFPELRLCGRSDKSSPGASCQNGFVRWPRMTVQQQDDVTEFQPRPFQISLHVLHQRCTCMTNHQRKNKITTRKRKK